MLSLPGADFRMSNMPDTERDASNASRPEGRPARPLASSPVARAVVAVLLLGLFILFVSLGTWQVERRAWKLDLIARVDARIHAAPVPLPPPADWPAVNRDHDEYRQVRVRGTFLHQHEAFVQASTVLGAGYWVLTPLQLADGHIVFINRGFVPPEYRAVGKRNFDHPEGLVEISGLMRMTEPKGGFLRDNNPADDRWYSRDVAAISASRHLDGDASSAAEHVNAGHGDAPSAAGDAGESSIAPAGTTPRVAPFFIDQALPVRSLASLDAPVDDTERWRPPPEGSDELALSHWMASQRKQLPMPGLTVVSFANSHLSYIFTWYSLAALVAFGAWKMLWVPRRERRRAGEAQD